MFKLLKRILRSFISMVTRLLKRIIIYIALLVYVIDVEPNTINVNHQSIKTDEVNDVRVVQFTDTHIGKYGDEDYVKRIADLINLQEPDIVVFTGDLYDNYMRDKDIIDDEIVISHLSSIKGEKYAVIGNHDDNSEIDLEHFMYIMKMSKFTVLDNKSVISNDIHITGLHTPNVEYTPSDEFELLLLHEPDYIDNINVKNSLALAGHTHGAQVNIPIISDGFTPKGGKNYRYGMYPLSDDTDLFVSRGIGFSHYPVRFRATPEIVVFDIGEATDKTVTDPKNNMKYIMESFTKHVSGIYKHFTT